MVDLLNQQKLDYYYYYYFVNSFYTTFQIFFYTFTKAIKQMKNNLHGVMIKRK